MNKQIDDGGPAFPCPTGHDGGSLYDGMTMRQWYATFAPKPDDADITLQRSYDRNRNPHNVPYKPPIRSKAEIIADLAFEYADAMITASRKGSDRG